MKPFFVEVVNMEGGTIKCLLRVYYGLTVVGRIAVCHVIEVFCVTE